MPYYLIEEPGGAVQVQLSDSPQPHWTPIPDADVDAVFAAFGQDRPFRIHAGALQVAERRPIPSSVWDWDSGTWGDARTLDDLKAEKWREIKRHRDAAEFATFVYRGMEFDGDLDAQRRLTAYISVSKSALAAGEPFAAEFTLADNSLVTLSAEDFVGIELAKVQAVASAFAHASALRLQIEAATTADALEALAW